MMMAMIDEPDQQELFQRIYRTHIGAMKAYAWKKMYRYPHLIEDVLQEALIKILPHLNKIYSLPEEDARAYLIAAVKTAAIDMLEKEDARQGQVVSLQAVSEDAVSDTTDVLEEVCAKDACRRLVQVIHSLPEEWRQVLYLHYLCQMDFRAISAHMNVPYETVRKRFQRGKKQLVQKLQEGGGQAHEDN